MPHDSVEPNTTPAESAATLRGMENLDELEAPQPVESDETRLSLEGAHPRPSKDEDTGPDDYDQLERDVSHVDEIAAPSPVEDRRTEDLEEVRSGSQRATPSPSKPAPSSAKQRLALLYTLSYLVFMSILGTLARLGLQAITIYPGAPVALGEIWANVAGSLAMGFLAEDRSLFRRDLDAATQRAAKKDDDGRSGDAQQQQQALRKEHLAIKKGIPLYVGLTVGFCGSFTTFSSFMRDAFLALSDDLNTATTSVRSAAPAARPRNDGYSVEAVLAVLILEVAASLAALDFGAHLALFVEPLLERLPRLEDGSLRAILDPTVAFMAWAAWLGAVLMAVWPPRDAWRGQAVFALVFAPAGCLLRFYLSLWLNGRVPRFPLGTFAANVGGTYVLGVAFDLQHSVTRNVVGCQVLQGIEDGFCGCLTTVSTWVLELKTLRRGHAYVYGVVSVAVALGGLVAIMGGLRWSEGFAAVVCKV